MNAKTSLVLLLVLLAAVPACAGGKKKKDPERAMLEKMEAVPCGAKQKGITGLGSVWASAGITHVNSDEKLCPQYMLRSDDMEYHIRPTDKHPVVLPVGQEVVFRIKKDHMLVKVPEGGDQKTRKYMVVAMKPNSDVDAQNTSGRSDRP
jgi:hypothetical protein